MNLSSCMIEFCGLSVSSASMGLSLCMVSVHVCILSGSTPLGSRSIPFVVISLYDELFVMEACVFVVDCIDFIL